jgi:hypothetical protein
MRVKMSGILVSDGSPNSWGKAAWGYDSHQPAYWGCFCFLPPFWLLGTADVVGSLAPAGRLSSLLVPERLPPLIDLRPPLEGAPDGGCGLGKDMLITLTR